MLKRVLTIILTIISVLSYGQRSSVRTAAVSTSPVSMSYDIRDRSLSGNKEDSHYHIGLADGWEKITGEDTNSVTFINSFETDRSWLDRNIYLVIEGYGQNLRVTVNGKDVGNSTVRGELRFDLTGFTVTGKNEIGITYSEHPCVYYKEQQNPDEPANAYIFSQPRIYIADIDVNAFTDGKGNGILNTEITPVNGYNTDENVTVGYDVIDMNGNIITYNGISDTLEKNETRRIVLSRKIADIKKWSPETPYLYDITFRIRHNDRYVEYITVRTGFRDIALTDGKLQVNGKETVLTGHIAENPDSVTTEKIKELKYRGINCITWVKQPVSERIYDLCDSLGLFICDNIAVNGFERNTSDVPSLKEAYIERVNASFNKHKNRPSVIMWSLGNDRSNGYNLYKSYLFLKELDPIRPVVTVSAQAEWNTDMTTGGESAISDKRGILLFGEEKVSPEKNIIGTFSN